MIKKIILDARIDRDTDDRWLWNFPSDIDEKIISELVKVLEKHGFEVEWSTILH